MNFFRQNKFRIIHENNDETTLFCSLYDLKNKYNIKNYFGNRQPDVQRIAEIKNYYTYSSKKLIDGVICCWQYKDNCLYIYDGIHRYSACCDLEMYAIVKIKKCSEQEMKNDFKIINMAISLPYLYIQENTELKRKVCEDVMKMFHEKWPNNKSTSRNCQRQNYNRDVFVDSILSKLDINWEKFGLSSSIFTSINAINTIAKKYVHENNISVPKKCDYNNFWLMYLGHDEIKNRLQNSILLK